MGNRESTQVYQLACPSPLDVLNLVLTGGEHGDHRLPKGEAGAAERAGCCGPAQLPPDPLPGRFWPPL